jgi:hypothetical protein
MRACRKFARGRTAKPRAATGASRAAARASTPAWKPGAQPPGACASARSRRRAPSAADTRW